MKTIIETDETNLCCLDFKKGKKMINWNELTKAEQVKILNAMSHFHKLFSKLLKTE